jgi:hypothetical protein
VANFEKDKNAEKKFQQMASEAVEGLLDRTGLSLGGRLA